MIWFALACAAILPVALDGLLTKADVDAPKVNRTISLVSLAGLAVAIVAFLAHSASWYVSDWHEQQIAAVRKATRDPSTRVWATDGTADWLLCGSPSSADGSPTTSASSSTTSDARPDRRLPGETRRLEVGLRTATGS